MKSKVYTYTDDLGWKKELWVTKLPSGKGYGFSIWDLATGVCCKSGKMTEADLREFLASHGMAFEK